MVTMNVTSVPDLTYNSTVWTSTVDVNVTSVPGLTFNSTVWTSTEHGPSVVWLPTYWSSFIENPMSWQRSSFGGWIRLVGLPPALLLGFVGNVLTVLVMCRTNMRRHSYSSYLVLLAVCDSLSLVLRLLYWINLLQVLLKSPVKISYTTRFACVLNEYLSTGNTIICSWTVVCITFERVIVVLFPLTGTKICKPSVSRKTVLGLIVCPFILVAYIPRNTLYLPELGCVMKLYPDGYLHYILATSFVTMIPLGLIFLGNTAIIISLRLQKRKIRGIGTREEKVARVTTMLVAVSLTFFVLVLPNAILALTLAIRPDLDFLQVAVDPLAFLWDLNFAVNFYLYVITGSAVRLEVKTMLCEKSVGSTVTVPTEVQRASAYRY